MESSSEACVRPTVPGRKALAAVTSPSRTPSENADWDDLSRHPRHQPATGVNALQPMLLGLPLLPAVAAGEAATSVVRWLTEIGTGALVVTAASLFWSLRLRRQVRQRAAELE